MDFQLSETEQAVRETAREFARKTVEPVARELDSTGRFPSELVRAMGEVGLMGIPVPEVWGGAGCTAIAYNLAVLEISQACASTGVILSAHTSLCVDPLLKHGTDAQKDKYLGPSPPERCSGAYALTEPGAGSDAANLACVAEDRGDHFALTGTKLFVTNGGFAGVIVVYASTDRSAGHKGISAFLVEPGFPGFALGKTEKKLGINASSTAELVLTECRVPKENLLGPLGKGFSIAPGDPRRRAHRDRVASHRHRPRGARGSGAARKTREQFGAPLAKLEAVQFAIADMATDLDAAELLMLRAASLKDGGSRRFTKEAAMAKLFASEAAFRAADMSLQLHGGYGFIKEYNAERHYRDVRICRLYEGTSEIQRLVIAANVLKDL